MDCGYEYSMNYTNDINIGLILSISFHHSVEIVLWKNASQFINPVLRHVDWKKFCGDTPSSPEVIEGSLTRWILGQILIALDQLVFRFWMSWAVREIFAIKVGSCAKWTEILHVFGPQNFFGESPPNFWSKFIQSRLFSIMWQSFRAIGRGISEKAWRKKRNICGRI